MKKLMVWLMALLALSGALAMAQQNDVTGIWQGMMKTPGKDLRTVMRIAKGDGGTLKTTIYSIDQGGQPIPIPTTTVSGSDFRLTIVAMGVKYDGKLSADGKSIAGTFTQAGTGFPLDFTRVTEASAWTIPEPVKRIPPMAADAKPAFEVATIKPSKPDAQGRGLVIDGRLMKTSNTSVEYLITFAYGLQQKQVMGGPAWMADSKFDIQAQPDVEGTPNVQQLRIMVQKLLADRFGLKFHNEKKELSVYALTVAKTGSRLTGTTAEGALPGLFFQGIGKLVVRNATMRDFADLMQTSVLDRPIADQTGLGAARFDFTLNWTADESQFGGMGIKVPPPSDAANAPPPLFTAMPEQLGLRLDATKTPVEVMVVDKVEKPTEN